MKKALAVVAAVFLFMLCGCRPSSDMNRVSINYGQSQMYSQKDMDAAISVIKKEFSSWDGCVLHSIAFTSDSVCADNVEYCNSLREGAGFDECIVFESSFHSPRYAGGGGFTPDQEYRGWSWYLARKDNGAWQLLTWGYA
ncbi:MAG TPA: hypothetical protein PL044_00510 [Clostridiales bacterium]|nr:hypothetical protein [Clostridiales bacterium]HQH62938.1 hypothetical protein [Clostridiales bacterium]HQK72248.1 hypothetical protein [Clostridiales bacterium]